MSEKVYLPHVVEGSAMLEHQVKSHEVPYQAVLANRICQLDGPPKSPGPYPRHCSVSTLLREADPGSHGLSFAAVCHFTEAVFVFCAESEQTLQSLSVLVARQGQGIVAFGTSIIWPYSKRLLISLVLHSQQRSQRLLRPRCGVHKV